jgi:hypothetical protein
MVERRRSTDAAKADKPVINLWLDSGAFSAWSQGITIDIDEYCDYIEKHKHLIAHYVNLDTIPGTKGQVRTGAMAEAGATSSFKNYEYMRKRGLNPIPVVHSGEPYKWVQRYLDAGADYIGLAPSITTKGVDGAVMWLDPIFTKLCDKEGRPKVKTHGFAVASFDLMRRYPWYTCDATSWALTAAYGGIFFPIYRAGEPDYAEPPIKVTVSRYENRESMPNDHYDAMGPMVQARIRAYLKDETGLTIDEVASDYEARARAIVHFMLRFEAAIGEVRFKHQTGGGFLL